MSIPKPRRLLSRSIPLLTTLLSLLLVGSAASGGITRGGPSVEEAIRHSIDSRRMVEADQLINDAIARGDIPGAVLLVGRSDGVVYRKAYGKRAILPAPEEMTPETIFDLAS